MKKLVKIQAQLVVEIETQAALCVGDQFTTSKGLNERTGIELFAAIRIPADAASDAYDPDQQYTVHELTGIEIVGARLTD